MPDHLDSRGIVNPETVHEESDVNVRALLWAMVIFVIFAILTWLAILLMFRFYSGLFRGETSAPMTSIAMPPDANVPQSPRLQPFPNRDTNGTVIPPNRNTPVTDMEDMRAAEELALRNPGWIDRQKGVVRLPIEVAKQLVLERGFPVNTSNAANEAPSAPQVPAGANTSAPGVADSSSVAATAPATSSQLLTAKPAADGRGVKRP